MVKFKYQKKILYIEDRMKNSIIHYVPDGYFLLYLEKRKVAPNICKLFSTIKERTKHLENLEILL